MFHGCALSQTLAKVANPCCAVTLASLFPPSPFCQVYIWNSKQGPTRRPSGHSVSSAGPAMGVGGDAAAAAPTTARVKSRTSLSFSVQCSARPKIVTVAAFVPAAALHSVLEGSEGCDVDRSERGGGGGEDVFPETAGGGAGYTPKEGIVKGSRGWRGNRLRRSSAPVAAESFGDAAATVVGDEGDGLIRLRRRRWSFTGQGRLSSGGGSSAGITGSTKSWQQPWQKVCVCVCWRVRSNIIVVLRIGLLGGFGLSWVR